jgi:hypothetical protein
VASAETVLLAIAIGFQPDPRIVEIASRIRESRDAVERLALRYVYHLDWQGAGASLTEIEASTTTEEAVCLFDGTRKYCRRRFESAHRGTLTTATIKAAWDGGRYRMEQGAVHYMTAIEDGFAFDNIYFGLLMWPKSMQAQKEVARNSGDWLPEMIVRPGWRVKQDGETVILECAERAMTLELASKLHFAPQRIVYGAAHASEVRFTDHVSVAGGALYIPRLIEGACRPGMDRGRADPSIPFRLTVKQIAEGRIDESVFSFAPGPGFLVEDRIRGRRRLQPNLQPEIVEVDDDPIERLFSQQPSAAPSPRLGAFWILAGAAILTTTACLAIRRRAGSTGDPVRGNRASGK